MNLRTIAAVWAGKGAATASRLLGRGGGTAIAGLVAERVDPHVVAHLAAQAGAGAIAVTGTNGKTTTSLMLNRIAAEAGLRPLHNRSGSNLMRGVAAMLVGEASLSGSIPEAARRLAILEVDEATLPEIVRAVAPRVAVFTNLFRDQLDRYGEVDTVAKSWERALAASTSETTLVLNADDPAVAHLGRSARGPVVYYGVDDATAGGAGDEHASDFRTCLQCGAELAYDVTFYGHIGHWRCPSCGNARPQPDVRVPSVRAAEEATALTIETSDSAFEVTLPLSGLYNAYNALAAAAGAIALGLPRDAIVRALDGFEAAFGRQERFAIDGRDVRVLLGKNPTGLNQVLRSIAAREGRKRIVFFLNDGIADGRDVSWIWDADYEIVQPQTDVVIASGTRAEDLALRLKYAGFGDDVPLERDAARAVRRALDATPPGETLHVVPTYTAMLDVRELLAKRGGAKRFWEDA
ncbi:MAG TPA: MurT ligase domain-containing protein [Dehalococcoidia bacterium]|nr:MurT ligase domain-containing protein [Dehalococcoidia bacterium]